MNYNNPVRNSSTVTIQVMCAIVFLLFCFSWLFWFQSDLLAMAQHVLSGGLTVYHPLLAALAVTLMLQALQLGIFLLTGLRRRAHALTYVPSMLFLAVLSSVDEHVGSGSFWDTAWWVVLLLLLWAGAVVVARFLQSVERDRRFGLTSRPMWINMLVMALLILFVAAIANTNAVFHYRLRAENCLLKGDFDGALRVGQKSLESDASLQAIRMYALARQRQLGERLFQYPVSAGSSLMLPSDSLAPFLIYPVDSLRRSLRDPRMRADYRLCGFLLDKQLDRFVSELPRHYRVDARLPRHYREALTLYTHLRSHPRLVYHEPVMDEDYDNLQQLSRQYASPTERQGKVEEQYRNTYWYYYQYM